jgi:RimJ/RimL family protein N-acetyltransferase
MRLRPYAEEDRWLTIELEGNPEVMQHLGGTAPDGRADRVHEQRLNSGSTAWYRTILDGPDDSPAGVVAVFHSTWDGRTIAELGIMLRPGLGQRHGLGAGAVRLIVAEVQASNLVREIHAFIGTGNRAAAAVARRTGFVKTGPCDVDYEGVPMRSEHWLLDLTETTPDPTGVRAPGPGPG